MSDQPKEPLTEPEPQPEPEPEPQPEPEITLPGLFQFVKDSFLRMGETWSQELQKTKQEILEETGKQKTLLVKHVEEIEEKQEPEKLTPQQEFDRKHARKLF